LRIFDLKSGVTDNSLPIEQIFCSLASNFGQVIPKAAEFGVGFLSIKTLTIEDIQMKLGNWHQFFHSIHLPSLYKIQEERYQRFP